MGSSAALWTVEVLTDDNLDLENKQRKRFFLADYQRIEARQKGSLG